MKKCMHTYYILILMEIAFRSDSEYFKEKGIVYESIGWIWWIVKEDL